MHTKEEVFALLSEIPDPEIPVISIVELGVIREILIEGNHIEVFITPTYSGCPAMKQMEDDVRKKLSENGFDEIKNTIIYSPAWTTDWLSEDAKLKLQNYGIAPPEETTSDKSFLTNSKKKHYLPKV